MNQSLLFQRSSYRERLLVLHPRTIPDHGQKKAEPCRVQDGRGGGQLGPDVEEEEDRGELGDMSRNNAKA